MVLGLERVVGVGGGREVLRPWRYSHTWWSCRMAAVVRGVVLPAVAVQGVLPHVVVTQKVILSLKVLRGDGTAGL